MDADRAVEQAKQQEAARKAVADALMAVRQQPRNQQYDFKWLMQPVPHGDATGATRG